MIEYSRYRRLCVPRFGALTHHYVVSNIESQIHSQTLPLPHL